jgi:hypothetical protein
MKPAKWNTPLIAIGAAFMGAAAASYQVTGEWTSSPEATLPHAGYILTVAAVFVVAASLLRCSIDRRAEGARTDLDPIRLNRIKAFWSDLFGTGSPLFRIML